MFLYFLPFTEHVKVLLKCALLSGSLLVLLSIWGYSADAYVLFNRYYMTTSIVRCLQLHNDLFIFSPARIIVQIKYCYDFSVSGQTARARLWVIAVADAFYVSQFWSQWKSTCFYKSSPLRNTCTEQQAHCFPLSQVVKIWETSKTTPGRFAESLILPGATRLT